MSMTTIKDSQSRSRERSGLRVEAKCASTSWRVLKLRIRRRLAHCIRKALLQPDAAAFMAPIAIALICTCGYAQEPSGGGRGDRSPTFENDFNSGHLWRGLLLNDEPLVQPSARIANAGFTFAAWTNLPLNETIDSSHVNATGLSLTYGRDWKKLTIEPAAETYLSRWPQGGDDPNTMEGSLKLSYPAGPLRLFTMHAFDVLAYRGAYFGEAGLAYERQVAKKKAEISISFHSGWASSKFNDVYIGLNKPAFNFVGAEGSVNYYLKPGLYVRPHFELSRTVSRQLQEWLDSPSINRFGVALGMDF